MTKIVNTVLWMTMTFACVLLLWRVLPETARMFIHWNDANVVDFLATLVKHLAILMMLFMFLFVTNLRMGTNTIFKRKTQLFIEVAIYFAAGFVSALIH